MTRTHAGAPTGQPFRHLPIPTNIAFQILQLLSATDLVRFRTMSVEYGDIILFDKFIKSNILRLQGSKDLIYLLGPFKRLCKNLLYAGHGSSFGRTFLAFSSFASGTGFL
ncbi:hypothetical protein PS1_000775 [Malus domestica]